MKKLLFILGLSLVAASAHAQQIIISPVSPVTFADDTPVIAPVPAGDAESLATGDTQIINEAVGPVDSLIPVTPDAPVTPVAAGSSSSGGSHSSGSSFVAPALNPAQLAALLALLNPKAPTSVGATVTTKAVVKSTTVKPAVASSEAGVAADQLVANVGQTEIGFFTRVGNWFSRFFHRFI